MVRIVEKLMLERAVVEGFLKICYPDNFTTQNPVVIVKIEKGVWHGDSRGSRV